MLLLDFLITFAHQTKTRFNMKKFVYIMAGLAILSACTQH